MSKYEKQQRIKYEESRSKFDKGQTVEAIEGEDVAALKNQILRIEIFGKQRELAKSLV